MPTVAMFVTSSLLNDSRVLREAITLGTAGWKVHLFCYIAPEDVGKAQEVLPSNVQVHSVRKSHWKGKQREWLKKPSQVWDVTQWGGSRALYQASEHFRADVYHANDLDTLTVAARLARRWSAQLIYDSHELFGESLRQDDATTPFQHLKQALLIAAFERLEARYIGRAATVLTVCEAIADELEKCYHVSHPRVLMNCPPYQDVSASFDPIRQHLSLDRDTKIVLYQGSVGRARGLVPLVESLAYLPDRYTLVFLGFNLGDYQSAIRDRVASLGLAKRVFYLDAVSPRELLSYTTSADVGTLFIEDLNRSKRYALPNKMFEYMMAGLPFTATDMPEIQRVVRETNAGLILPAFNPESIAASIKSLVDDSARHEAMRQNGLRWAREKYNWELQSKTLLDAYDHLGKEKA